VDRGAAFAVIKEVVTIICACFLGQLSKLDSARLTGFTSDIDASYEMAGTPFIQCEGTQMESLTCITYTPFLIRSSVTLRDGCRFRNNCLPCNIFYRIRLISHLRMDHRRRSRNGSKKKKKKREEELSSRDSKKMPPAFVRSSNPRTSTPISSRHQSLIITFSRMCHRLEIHILSA